MIIKYQGARHHGQWHYMEPVHNVSADKNGIPFENAQQFRQFKRDRMADHGRHRIVPFGVPQRMLNGEDPPYELWADEVAEDDWSLDRPERIVNPECDWPIVFYWITFHHERTNYAGREGLLFNTVAYLMNDEGKTIDKVGQPA